jgi:hypothetical protein
MTNSNPEIPKASYLEVKIPCHDCPLRTSRTAKVACQHVWRHFIEKSIDPVSGEVPFDTPERSHALGAKVSFRLSDQIGRPSVQLYVDEPPQRHGFNRARIADN